MRRDACAVSTVVEGHVVVLGTLLTLISASTSMRHTVLVSRVDHHGAQVVELARVILISRRSYLSVLLC